MTYRLIALDIDGTIRSTDHPISDRTRKTIEAVMESGSIVTLVTGRVFRSALPLSTQLKIKSPIVTFQGAHIADPMTGEVMWHQPLSPEMVLKALGALVPWNLQVLAYSGDLVYANDLTPWVVAYGKRNQIEVHIAQDLKELATCELTRLVAVGNQNEIRALEIDLISKFDTGLYVTRSLPNFCEILHPNSGKDKALFWLCQQLGVREEQTIAFGNGYNDVQMLKWAGLGIAIEGAVAEALAVADMLAPPMEHDGVAQVLEDLLRRGLIG